MLGAGGYALGKMGAGPIDFDATNAGVVLGAAGASLPPLWWLLSSIPPKPVEEYFPAIQFLLNAQTKKQNPKTMPRLLKSAWLSAIVAGSIFAADPEISQHEFNLGDQDGPIVISIDNGYSSAQNWDQIQALANTLIDDAEKRQRDVVLIPTAHDLETMDNDFGKLVSPKRAKILMMDVVPQPWIIDYTQNYSVLDQLDTIVSNSSVFWMNNGIEQESSPEFLSRLSALGSVNIFQPSAEQMPLLLSQEHSEDNDLIVRVTRAKLTDEDAPVLLQAYNEENEVLVQKKLHFEEGAYSASVEFDIPHELRRQLAQIKINAQNHAGAVLLLDENWRERLVGIFETPAAGRLQDGSDYVRSAIYRFTELHEGSAENLSNFPLAVRVMTDEANVLGRDKAEILDWVEEGGMLIRFAGPNLANAPDDPLVPVEIRRGIISTQDIFTERQDVAVENIGKIASFSEQSPFNGLIVPEDVRVDKIVMPEPGLELEDYTWAKLSDGTPLVTARQVGDGWIVLFHTSANLEWSNLPLSQGFLDMMRSTVAYSQGGIQDRLLNRDLEAWRTLDAHGGLIQAPRKVRSLTPATVNNTIMNEAHQPGVYGDEKTRMAYNISDVQVEYLGWDNIPEAIPKNSYVSNNSEQDYSAFFLVYAFAAMMGASMWQLRQGGDNPDFGKRKNIFRRRNSSQSSQPELGGL